MIRICEGIDTKKRWSLFHFTEKIKKVYVMYII